MCLAVAQVRPGARPEHHWLRMCCARLGHLFPYLPKQPRYHKRLKAAAPLLAAALDFLATHILLLSQGDGDEPTGGRGKG